MFFDREIHEKDRRAKFGGKRAAKTSGKVNSLPRAGLLPQNDWKIVRASSEARGNGKLAKNAIDQDPRTHWHTQFRPKPLEHLHELVIDLGGTRTIRGFRYLARQDAGWNGAISECEFSVSNSAEKFGEPAVTTTFKKTKQPQEAKCQPVEGRCVRLQILSEVNDGPWASIAELGIVGQK